MGNIKEGQFIVCVILCSSWCQHSTGCYCLSDPVALHKNTDLTSAIERSAGVHSVPASTPLSRRSQRQTPCHTSAPIQPSTS